LPILKELLRARATSSCLCRSAQRAEYSVDRLRSGATEAWLVGKGFRVVAVPLDPVIPGYAKANGVEIVYGDLETSRRELSGQQFDCLLIADLLHLVPDPGDVLRSFGALLSTGSTAIITVPNICRFRRACGMLRSGEGLTNSGEYAVTGVHFTSHRAIRQWLRGSELVLQRVIDMQSERTERLNRLSLAHWNRF